MVRVGLNYDNGSEEELFVVVSMEEVPRVGEYVTCPIPGMSEGWRVDDVGYVINPLVKDEDGTYTDVSCNVYLSPSRK